MKTLAVVLFIALVASMAIYLARRPTIASGIVIETDLLVSLRKNGVSGLHCDREIPITHNGAVFSCLTMFDNGSSQNVEYTMDRVGQISGVIKDHGAGDTADHDDRRPAPHPTPRRTPSADPWGN